MVSAWLVVTTTLILSLLTIGAESAAGSDAPIPAARPERRPATGPAPPGERFPSVTNAGLTWSLAGARIVPGRQDDPSSRPIIVAEVFVANTTPSTVLRIREGDVRLRWPDGHLDTATRFEQTPVFTRFAVHPAQTLPVTVVFKPTRPAAPPLEQLALEIGERGREPSLLPLAGPVPDDGMPIEARISPEPSMLADPDQPGRRLIVAPRSARIDVEAGPYRAPLGRRLTVIEVSVQRSSATARSAHLQPDFWLLDAGDHRLAPLQVVPAIPATSNEDTLTLVFPLPVGMAVDPGGEAGGATASAAGPMTLTAGLGTATEIGYPILLR